MNGILISDKFAFKSAIAPFTVPSPISEISAEPRSVGWRPIGAGTTYTAGSGLNLFGTEFSVDTTVIQPKLTAGDGISINAGTISANIEPADYFTAGETVTGTGSTLTLNNTMNAKLDDAQLLGDTTQQTSSGKNLWGGFADFSRSSSNVDFVNYADGTIYMDGTASAAANSMISSEAIAMP